MKFSIINFGLLLVVATNASNPIGFGHKTTGGKNGVEYHVNNFKELTDALNNNGNPEAPKIIYIDSPMNGIIDENGKEITPEDLVPGFSFQKYLDCFTKDGSEWLDTDECNEIEELRKQGPALQEKLTKVFITPNTTIIGQGDDTKLEEISMNISNVTNVILKNLSIEAPNDFFPYWDPADGVQGSWKAEYDNIIICNSTNVWIDNCYLTDGNKKIGNNDVYFGKFIDCHDGLLDIVKESDDITISNNRFDSHRKTMLIGNKDKYIEDRDHLKVTIYNNVFINCTERLPRVRFGKIHMFNNYYYAETFNKGYPALTFDNYYKNYSLSIFPQYYIGLGIESNVLSEFNSFNLIGNEKIPATDDIIVFSYGGYTFHDNQSEFNGKKIDIDAIAKNSFNLKSKFEAEKNAAKGAKNPDWINATFTTETFQPSEFYHYNLNENIDDVNDLINKVPSWMFTNDSDSENEVQNDEDSIFEDDEFTIGVEDDN
ncbi:pectin lyase-like protein [Neocallimastix lanati (nom. inval.)]|uniref:Pectin lyase-like protein n=1 Tax=Neocallimastix californiae TaxID=1754190 RepID=A0A1Y2EM98_9FUNG|nr:pectin lyase-like protein [Neocallimastix sp. JGI-2020a]ORY72668.1 pectin lyase-like protein [Neocallimastix californiae]|eukprot:ORY72668.1 pectin lyase-like protein [Neocallimastix californiae]